MKEAQDQKHPIPPKPITNSITTILFKIPLYHSTTLPLYHITILPLLLPQNPFSQMSTPTPEPDPVAQPEAQTPDATLIYIPSYSRWFSWNNIHESEVRHLPEFFDGRCPSRNPKQYKYLRNSIINIFRVNPDKKVSVTEVRKSVVGDVGSIRRVFDFLESWGFINYAPSNNVTKAVVKPPRNRICNSCDTLCTIACYASDKHDMTLCARCYLKGNHRVEINSSDFKRVEISEETDWSHKEILQLLEAVMHYGDNWSKVASHVSGKTDKECIARFIKLPFADQFLGPPQLPPTKRKRLSPLADVSNPIMAQAAFLSAVAGVEVAQVAARAALVALSDLNSGKIKETPQEHTSGPKQKESDTITSNHSNVTESEAAIAEARLQLQKEEEELEGAISAIIVQTKEIEDHIVHLEDFELETKRRRRQLQQFQSLFSADQLKLVLQKIGSAKVNGTLEDNVKTE